LENIGLNALCKVAMLEELKDQEKYQPIVIAFGLDENVLQVVQ
jgi:hypothetical protein